MQKWGNRKKLDVSEKKILIISPNYPIPENTGAKIRTMNFARFFQSIGTVDLCYLGHKNLMSFGQETFSNEYSLKIESIKINFSIHFVNSLLRLSPVPIYNWSESNIKDVLNIIKKNDYDYIFLRYLQYAKILFKLKRKTKTNIIVDFDDRLSGSLYDLRFKNRKGLLKKILISLNKKILEKYERRCLRIGTTIFCSEMDRYFFNRKSNRDLSFVVPNIYSDQEIINYNFGNGFMKENILLFVGTLNYKPNTEGLKWFLKNIYPGFKRKYTDAALLVVGRSPNKYIIDLCAQTPGVQIFANAEDLKPYYEKCKAVIVPILAGGGTRIKIIEAAHCKRPILSTVEGAEGLKFRNKMSIYIFTNGHEFCSAYSKLSDRGTYANLIKEAKNVAERFYSIEEFNRSMNDVIEQTERIYENYGY